MILAAANANSTFVTVVVSTILGGGFIGGVVAYRKLKPESDQIIVSSAKDVVLIQKGALDDLRKQMDNMEDRFEQAAQAAAIALAECHAERGEFRRERDAAREDNAKLLVRIEHLEAEVAQLRAGTSGQTPKGTP